MKLSFATALLILALGTLLAWRNQERFSTVREEQRRLVAEAGELGMDPGAQDPGKRGRPVVRVREDRTAKEQEARDFTRELVTIFREGRKAEGSADLSAAELQKRTFALLDRLLDLDVSQIRVALAELQSAQDLDADTRRQAAAFIARAISDDHPETVLALFSEDPEIGKGVAEAALSKLAERDSAAALDWIRRNAKEHPELVGEEVKRGVIGGVSVQDPKLAFQLIRELKPGIPGQICSTLAGLAKTPEQRKALVEAFRSEADSFETEEARDMMNSTRDVMNRNLFGGFAKGMAYEGFDAAQPWLSSMSLKPDELAAFAGSLSAFETNGETGRWIEWMGGSLSGTDLNTRVGGLVREWTSLDYKAAGEWLNSTPDGPARLAAISSYARAVAPYEPQTAAQWVQTLPAGAQRKGAARYVYQDWKKKDAAAAAAFARQQGIEE